MLSFLEAPDVAFLRAELHGLKQRAGVLELLLLSYRPPGEPHLEGNLHMVS